MRHTNFPIFTPRFSRLLYAFAFTRFLCRNARLPSYPQHCTTQTLNSNAHPTILTGSNRKYTLFLAKILGALVVCKRLPSSQGLSTKKRTMQKKQETPSAVPPVLRARFGRIGGTRGATYHRIQLVRMHKPHHKIRFGDVL